MITCLEYCLFIFQESVTLCPLNYVTISSLGFFLPSDLEEFGYVSPFIWLLAVKSLTWVHILNFSFFKGTCTTAGYCVVLMRMNKFPFQRNKHFKTNLAIMPHVPFFLQVPHSMAPAKKKKKERPSKKEWPENTLPIFTSNHRTCTSHIKRSKKFTKRWRHQMCILLTGSRKLSDWRNKNAP